MNKMIINQRLDEFLKSEKISNEEFRKAIGLNAKAQVSNWLTGKEPIPKDHIINTIIAYKKLNGRWLLTGEGDMYSEINKVECKNESELPISMDISAKTNNCLDCFEKQKEIERLKTELLETKDKYITLLEEGNSLVRKQNCG
jgi:hypothetical protein